VDFSLSEEQRALQELARQILEDHSSNERLREIEASGERYDDAAWRALGAAGLLGLALDEAQGGMGMDFESLCLLVEEVGWTVAAVPVIASLVSAALPIAHFGSDEQKARLLPSVARGEAFLSAGLGEPGSEDPASPQTHAVRVDAGFALTGVKCFVPYANRAQRVLVAARTEAGEVGVFLIDPKAEGVILASQVSTAREPQFEINLNAVVVPDTDVLVEPGQGAEVMRWITDRTVAALCAMATGVGERATRMTAAYTAEREQFGVKIATFQAVGQRAANCYIDMQCLRLTTQQAVSLLSAGRDARDEVMIAKVWAGDALHRISHAAQHLHGGIGVDRDYPLFRYCLFAKQIELSLGASSALIFEIGEGIAAEFAGSA
jgi:alkylation response protein AidB-like acyl-CoA dehydrogenase